MDTTELVLLLSDVPGLGPATLAAMLRRMAVLRYEPEQLLALSAEALTNDCGVPPSVARAVGAAATGQLRQRAVERARLLARGGIRVLTLADACYPVRLLNSLPDVPSVMYAYGSLALLDRPIVAVANSNHCPAEALDACESVLCAALGAGWVVTTGHNRAEYQMPALAARRCGGPVCYVLDRGIVAAFGSDLTRELFPAARIWTPSFDPQHDLVLSTCHPWNRALGLSNRVRDEVIFGLADAVVVGYVRPGGVMDGRVSDAIRRGVSVLTAVVLDGSGPTDGRLPATPDNIAKVFAANPRGGRGDNEL